MFFRNLMKWNRRQMHSAEKFKGKPKPRGVNSRKDSFNTRQLSKEEKVKVKDRILNQDKLDLRYRILIIVVIVFASLIIMFKYVLPEEDIQVRLVTSGYFTEKERKIESFDYCKVWVKQRVPKSDLINFPMKNVFLGDMKSYNGGFKVNSWYETLDSLGRTQKVAFRCTTKVNEFDALFYNLWIGDSFYGSLESAKKDVGPKFSFDSILVPPINSAEWEALVDSPEYW